MRVTYESSCEFFQKSLCQALCRLLAQEFNLTRSRLTLSASNRSGVASTSETFNDFTFFTSRLFSLFLSLLNYIIFFMKTHFIMLSRLESLVRRKRFTVWDIREGYALIIIFYYSWEAAAHLGFHHRKRVGKVFFLYSLFSFRPTPLALQNNFINIFHIISNKALRGLGKSCFAEAN